MYYSRLIPLSKKKKDFLKDYIKKYLKKKFIRLLKLYIAYEVLFAIKKNDGLRLYIDY